MNSITVSKAVQEDLQLIHDMAEIVFRHTYREILSPEQMEYMMEWMYSLPNLRKQVEEGHVYYLAYSDKNPCGYLSVQPEGMDDGGVMVFHLQKIYVLPDYQGKGVGRILFGKAQDHVRELCGTSPARIELNVNRFNPSVDFYRHLGMTILRQGDFHIGNGFYMNDYIMGIEVLNHHNKEEYPPMHTAEHILNATMVRMFGCPRSRNAHIEKKKSKCDYILDSEPAQEEISDIEAKVNEVIASEADVTVSYVDRSEAATLVDLSKLPEDASERLRIVRVGDYDVCACIGKHVSNTREIGRFRILSHSFSDGIWRVRWKVSENQSI